MREEATSTTVASKAIFTTGMIDTKQKIDLMRIDIPNEFVKTEIALYGDKVITNVRG